MSSNTYSYKEFLMIKKKIMTKPLMLLFNVRHTDKQHEGLIKTEGISS